MSRHHFQSDNTSGSDREKQGQCLTPLQRELLRAIAARLEKQAALPQWCAAQSQPVPAPTGAETARLAVPQSLFPSSPKLSKIFQFIETNYYQPIQPRHVAQAIGYSPAYLTDLVRRQTGKTLGGLIVERRMAVVRSLLLETDQTVNQIAEGVGYQNAGPFFRQFQKLHGTTPQAWRNAHRTQSRGDQIYV